MGRAIFNRYWKERYSDAPDGQPHDDNNVPYEHLQEYTGREVFYNSLGDMTNGKFMGRGVLNVSPNMIDITSNSGRFTIPQGNVQSIKWVESEQSYVINDMIEINVE